MLYRDGLAVVFGPPGAAKSFLMLDIALSVATGRPWRGRPVKRGRVHYVMAEGQATNMLRTRAWLQHHDVNLTDPEGWFDAFPQAVLLTEAGVVDYQREVERDKPDLIVLDTKNLMFAGKESQGDDYGAMLRVLHQLRAAAADGCAIVLIDHTGLGDDTRVRGSNAQKGGVETEVRVVEVRDGVREVTVERDKSGVTGARWLFKLHQVDVTPRPPDVDPPAVCVQVDPSELRPDAGSLGDLLQGRWWDPDQPPLPPVLAELGGRGADAARDIYRVLRFVADADGLTTGEIRAAIDESPRGHSKASFFAGLAVLKERGLATPGATAARLRVG
jgi:hypothetical protein